MVTLNSKTTKTYQDMMEPNHRRSNRKQTITTEMHELSQCSDTNFVTTRTQGHVTGTKGMGRYSGAEYPGIVELSVRI